MNAHDSVLLWPEGAPGATGTGWSDQPGLTIHRAGEHHATGAAVIVNPGGGFSKLASDNEGLHVALWLNAMGVSAFVLRYRLRPDYEPSDSCLDARRAIRYVRHHAESLGVDPNRVGMMGFSAGAILAMQTATRYDPGDPAAVDPIDRASSRPDFSILIYPSDRGVDVALVTADTPPAFLAATHEDRTVSPKAALRYYEALLDRGVQAEMHVFGRGLHGTGMASGDPGFGNWPGLLADWLRTRGFLTGKERISVQGSITIDGEPPVWGSISLIPEDPNAPLVWTHTSGQFQIDASCGPVAGVHRVHVNILSRDSSGMKSGRFSTDKEQRYTRASPDAGAPLTVDIAPGKAIQISISTR
jgi:acetyl esterase/lipase